MTSSATTTAQSSPPAPCGDWCRFAGTGTSNIDPGSQWYPWVESYGSRMRDEPLAVEQSDTLLEGRPNGSSGP